MNRHQGTRRSIGAALLLGTLLGPALTASTAEAASAVSPSAIASAAAGQGNDFWEDRFNAMQDIWGTPYVPLGYYWDRARGLPPRQAPVAPGIYADRPIYPYGGFAGRGGFGRGLGYGHGYGYGTTYSRGYGGYAPVGGHGYGYGHGYAPGPGYGGYGQGYRVLSYPGYGSPYGGFYGW
jgi:hypothetical protein